MVGSNTKERSNRATAVFDVDSASVGVGIFIHGAETDELVWSCRVTYSVQQELDYTRFVRTMLSALLEAGMRLSTEGLPHMHTSTNAHVRHMDCLCVLSGPWFMGSIATNVLKDEKTIVVSQTFIKKQTELLRQELETSPAGEHFKSAMRGADLLEANVLRVLVNGYPVEDWRDRKCMEVSLSAWFALTSPDVLTHIQEVVQKVLPNTETTYRSSTLALYDVVRARLPHVHRLTIVEMGGELTAVTSVESGVMQGTYTFPLGSHSVLRTLIRENETETHARGRMALLKKKTPDSPELPENVRTTLENWSTQVNEGIRTLYNGITPARNIVLVADRDFSGWCAKLLETPVYQHGIREPIGFRTVPLVPSLESTVSNLPDDARLSVLGFGLSTGRGEGV